MLSCLCPACGETLGVAFGSAVLQGTSRRLMIRLNRVPVLTCARCAYTGCAPAARAGLGALAGQAGSDWELRAAHLGVPAVG